MQETELVQAKDREIAELVQAKDRELAQALQQLREKVSIVNGAVCD